MLPSMDVGTTKVCLETPTEVLYLILYTFLLPLLVPNPLLANFNLTKKKLLPLIVPSPLLANFNLTKKK